MANTEPDVARHDATAGPTATPGAGRTAWVDVAKGISISLVVLQHVVGSLIPLGWAPEVAQDVSAVFTSQRMPLFFLASGIFATRILAGPWRRLAEHRLAFLVWLYVLWCVIRYVWFALLAHGTDLGSWPSLLGVLSELWLPASALWFIYALALFSVIGRATRAVPAAIRLGAAVVLSALVGSGTVVIESYAWRVMAVNLVFFLLGADASVVIRGIAVGLSRGAATGVAVVATAAFVGLTIPLRFHGAAAVPGMRLVTSAVALLAGVALAVAIAGTRVGRPAQWLGSRTLDVYLLHGLLLAAVVRVGIAVHPGGLGGGPGTVLVLGTTAGVVVVCLAAARGLRVVGAGWLFAPPWHGREDRAAASSDRDPDPTAGRGRGSAQRVAARCSGAGRREGDGPMQDGINLGAALAGIRRDDERYADTLMLSALPGAPVVPDHPGLLRRIRL